MINKILEKTRKIETLLTNNYGAKGKGLHEKASSVEAELAPDKINKIRWIATIRNKSVHEDGFEIEDLNIFLKNCDDVITYLESNNSYSLNSYTNQSHPINDNREHWVIRKKVESWWKKLNAPMKWSIYLTGALGLGVLFYFYWVEIVVTLVIIGIAINKIGK